MGADISGRGEMPALRTLRVGTLVRLDASCGTASSLDNGGVFRLTLLHEHT